MKTEATIEKDNDADKHKSSGPTSAKTEADKHSESHTNSTAGKSTNSNKNDSKKSDKAKKPKPEKQSSSGSFTGTLGFLLSIAALGGGYWLWQQLDNALDYNQQLAAELRSSMEQTKNSIENNNRAQSEQLNSDLQSITQQQQGVETQLKNLLTSIGNSSRDWKVAEAKYLLEIANHKLQLQRDVPTSIAALKLADARIRSTGEPALLKVREVIAKEITSLETFAQPDTTGASLKLSSIADEVSKLPLQVRVQQIGSRTATPENSSDSSNAVENLPSAMWNSLKGLVTIRYNDRPIEPLLTPTQASNLNENVQIKLEQARLAILQGDQKIYNDNLDKAVAWLEQFYQIQNESVTLTIAQLKTLRELNVKPDLPDISTSLRELKNMARRLQLDLEEDKQGGKP
ncbi:MAG: uroporphyrinogen-III C-methyltransferase [Gammaproteobacteria bacterium]|nr:uroporphyrinogen-III C-methyltransferase [Gammaproteobacteria bacterium]